MTHDPNGPDRYDLTEIDPLLAETLWAAKGRAEQHAGQWDVEAELSKARKRLSTAHQNARGQEKGEQQVGDERLSKTRGLRRIPILGSQTLRGNVWSAAIAVMAALSIILLMYRVPAGAELTNTYSTLPGQQGTFTLPDSTRVTLAPRTTLRVTHFGSSSRLVELEGQAFFEVVRSTATPFIVRTGTVMTQVLGTSFLIQHYANDAHVRVAVVEGKVGVTSVPSSRYLVSPLTIAAQHIGDVTDSTVVVSRVDDLTPETDWLQGKLVFRNAPVSDVLLALSRWYGYQFRCSDSTISRQSVTLALEARSSAAALATLEQILSVHLTIVGDTVTLTPHQHTSAKSATRKQMYDMWIPTREAGR